MSAKTMLIFTSEWQGVPTFRLMPIDSSCPYLEMIFMPQYQGLGVIHKHVKTMLKMIERLNDDGAIVKIKGTNNPKQERQKVPVEYEYFLPRTSEIIDLIEMFAVNAEEFDYQQYFAKIEMVPEDQLPKEEK